MTDSPDVSIIVPAYNRVHVLHRSLLSILAQRGLRVELIVVDDCSTDDTWDHLQLIARENPDHMIRLLRLERNSAQATARNRGLDIARAPYIAFLDTDDALADQDILADMLADARRRDLDMLVAPFVYFDGTDLTRVSDLRLGGTVTDALDDPRVVDARSHWHILYARAFLDRVPLRFAETIRHREDRPFLTGALLNARRIGSFARPMVHYFRDMADSVMNNPTLREFGFYLEHLREVNRWMDLARAENRLHPDFEGLNAVLYACSHLHYWAPAWRELTRAVGPEMRAMLAAFDVELDRLFRHTGPLYPLDAAYPVHPVIRDAGRELVSGRVDLLRHAVLNRDHDLFRALLSGPDLPLSQLYQLKGAGPEAEEIAQRALAFAGRRTGIAGTAGRDRKPGGLVPRILLHVGGMKTGSSALQNWLEANRFALLDQGFLYPATGTWREDGVRSNRNSGHDALIWALLHADGAADMRRALMAEIAALPKPPETLILSLETIVSPKFELAGFDFNAIAAALGGGIEVVWLEREAAPWLASIHREQICNPRNAYLGTLEELVADYRDHGLLDADHVRAMLEAPAQVRRLHHARYEEVLAQGGTIAHFCTLAGIDPTGMRKTERAESNPSFSDEQAGRILALKHDAALTPLQRDEAFRQLADGRSPDLAGLRARYPAARPLPNRLARLAAINAALPRQDGIGLHLLAPDLQLLILPSDIREARIDATALRLVVWEGVPVALLDSRLIGALGPSCRLVTTDAAGNRHETHFDVLRDDAAGLSHLAPQQRVTPKLHHDADTGESDGMVEVTVRGAADPVAALDWLSSQPGLSVAGRMSPWRRVPTAKAQPLGNRKWRVPRAALPPDPAPRAPDEAPRTPLAAVTAMIAPAFYQSQLPDQSFPDAAAAARHYLSRGHATGLDPAPWFSERGYLRDHPDVAAARMPAFVHFLLHGVGEGRQVRASARATAAGTGSAALTRLRPALARHFAGRQARLLLLSDEKPDATLPENVLPLGPDRPALLAGLKPADLAAAIGVIAELAGARGVLGLGGPFFSAALQGGLAGSGVTGSELAGSKLRVEGWFGGDLALADLPLLGGLHQIHLPPGRFEAAFVNWRDDLPPLSANSPEGAIRAALQR